MLKATAGWGAIMFSGGMQDKHFMTFYWLSAASENTFSPQVLHTVLLQQKKKATQEIIITFHTISNAETRLQHWNYEVPLILRACHVTDRKLHQLYCHVWKRRQQQVRNKQLAELREWAITPSQNRYVCLLYFSAQWQTHWEKKWTKVTFGSWESIPYCVIHCLVCVTQPRFNPLGMACGI